MKFPHVSHAVGLCVLLAACAGAKVEQISHPADLSFDHAKVRIDAPDKAAFTIADARLRPRVVSLALPFQLAEVPKTAKLEMIVSPLTTACPLARQPQGSTRISLNNQPVTEFTLGPDRVGQTHRVSAAVDVRFLRAGENVLQVNGAPCTLGNFEVVQFNGIALTAPR